MVCDFILYSPKKFMDLKKNILNKYTRMMKIKYNL